MKSLRLINAGKCMLAVAGLVLATPGYGARIQPNNLWRKKNLRVCFADSRRDLADTAVSMNGYIKPDAPDGIDVEKLSELKIVPFPADLKPWIQKAVEDSFTPEKTGIYFTGWSNCKIPHDVAVIYVMDDLDRDPDRSRSFGAGSIGEPEKNSRTSVRLNDSKVRGYQGDFIMPSIQRLAEAYYGKDHVQEKIWANFSRYDFLRAVVHEFGHITGLRHEQERFSKENFMKYDVSHDHETSATLISNNEFQARVSALLPKDITRNIGKPNPLSTMHYFFDDYDGIAEKTRMVCELVDRSDLNFGTEYLLSKLYGFLAHMERKQVLESKIPYHAGLKTLFCANPLYLQMTPKALFEKGGLLDTQSQAALRKIYLHEPFKDPLVQDPSQLDYVRTFWGAMTDFYW